MAAHGKSRSGALDMIVALLFLLSIAFCAIYMSLKDSQPAPQPVPVATATEAPTEAPTVEPTAAPPTLAESAQAIGEKVKETGWEFLSCDVQQDVIFVDVKRNSDWFDDEFMLVGAIRWSIEYIKEIYALDHVPPLYFSFHEDGIDKNGYPTDMITITMRITPERAGEINLDYFHEYAVTRQLAYLKAINSYSLHKDYKAIAK